MSRVVFPLFQFFFLLFLVSFLSFTFFIEVVISIFCSIWDNVDAICSLFVLGSGPSHLTTLFFLFQMRNTTPVLCRSIHFDSFLFPIYSVCVSISIPMCPNPSCLPYLLFYSIRYLFIHIPCQPAARVWTSMSCPIPRPWYDTRPIPYLIPFPSRDVITGRCTAPVARMAGWMDGWKDGKQAGVWYDIGWDYGIGLLARVVVVVDFRWRELGSFLFLLCFRFGGGDRERG